MRVPDLEALRAGGALVVIELNGLTSEATHVYDPRHTLREAYRGLCEQWRLAFEIAAANRRHGARPAALADVLRLYARYRRQAVRQPARSYSPPPGASGAIGCPSPP